MVYNKTNSLHYDTSYYSQNMQHYRRRVNQFLQERQYKPKNNESVVCLNICKNMNNKIQYFLKYYKNTTRLFLYSDFENIPHSIRQYKIIKYI